MDVPETSPLAAPSEHQAIGNLDRPAFLMCAPFTHSAAVPNNIWMREYPPGEGVVDPRRSMTQFTDLYGFLASEALVYLLPGPLRGTLQDLVFTANLAFIPADDELAETAIVANFTSAPRRGEAPFGERFFESLGYRTMAAPYRFEGEAEIKHLHGNVYAGGYGERTDRRIYDWMTETFGLKIIPLEERYEHLYHLDCSVFPLSREETIVCTSLFRPEEIRSLEKATNIIDVTEDQAFQGICNSVRLNNLVLNASNLPELAVGHAYYAPERDKNRRLEDICAARGMEPVFFNLSEYLKSGALLSCMVMHLNRRSYDVQLV